MSTHFAYFDREVLTWSELCKVLMVWLQYGDDPFEDEYSNICEELQNTTDEKRRERLQIILSIMDFLRNKMKY
jgi:hypothetical protein